MPTLSERDLSNVEKFFKAMQAALSYSKCKQTVVAVQDESLKVGKTNVVQKNLTTSNVGPLLEEKGAKADPSASGSSSYAAERKVWAEVAVVFWRMANFQKLSLLSYATSDPKSSLLELCEGLLAYVKLSLKNKSKAESLQQLMQLEGDYIFFFLKKFSSLKSCVIILGGNTKLGTEFHSALCTKIVDGGHLDWITNAYVRFCDEAASCYRNQLPIPSLLVASAKNILVSLLQCCEKDKGCAHAILYAEPIAFVTRLFYGIRLRIEHGLIWPYEEDETLLEDGERSHTNHPRKQDEHGNTESQTTQSQAVGQGQRDPPLMEKNNKILPTTKNSMVHNPLADHFTNDVLDSNIYTKDELSVILDFGRNNPFSRIVSLALSIVVEAVRLESAYDHNMVFLTLYNFLTLSAKSMGPDRKLARSPTDSRSANSDSSKKKSLSLTPGESGFINSDNSQHGSVNLSTNIAMYENVVCIVSLFSSFFKTLACGTDVDNLDRLISHREVLIMGLLQNEVAKNVALVLRSNSRVLESDFFLFRSLREISLLDEVKTPGCIEASCNEESLSRLAASQALGPDSSTEVASKTPNMSFQGAATLSEGVLLSSSMAGKDLSMTISRSMERTFRGPGNLRNLEGSLPPNLTFSPPPAENFAKSLFKSFFGATTGGLNLTSLGSYSNETNSRSDSISIANFREEGGLWYPHQCYADFVRELMMVLCEIFLDEKISMRNRLSAGCVLADVTLRNAITFDLYEGRITLRSFLNVMEEKHNLMDGGVSTLQPNAKDTGIVHSHTVPFIENTKKEVWPEYYEDPEYILLIHKALSSLERAYEVIGLPPLTTEAVLITELPLKFFSCTPPNPESVTLAYIEHFFTRVIALWTIGLSSAECDEDIDRRSLEVLTAIFKGILYRGFLPRDATVPGSNTQMNSRDTIPRGMAKLLASKLPDKGENKSSGDLQSHERESLRDNFSLLGSSNTLSALLAQGNFAEGTSMIPALGTVFRIILQRSPSVFDRSHLELLFSMLSNPDVNISRLGKNCIISSLDSSGVYSSYASVIENGDVSLMAQLLPLISSYLTSEERNSDTLHERRVWLLKYGCIDAAIRFMQKALSVPQSTPFFVKILPVIFRFLSSFEPQHRVSPRLAETDFVRLFCENFRNVIGAEHFIIVTQSVLDAATNSYDGIRGTGGYDMLIMGTFRVSSTNCFAEKTIFLDLIPTIVECAADRDVGLRDNLLEAFYRVLKHTTNIQSEALVNWALKTRRSVLLPYLELPSNIIQELPYTGDKQTLYTFWTPILLGAPLKSEISFAGEGGISISIGLWPEKGFSISALFKFEEITDCIDLFQITSNTPSLSDSPASLYVSGGDSVQLLFCNRRTAVNENHALQELTQRRWIHACLVFSTSDILTVYFNANKIGTCPLPYFPAGCEVVIRVGAFRKGSTECLYSISDIGLWDTQLTSSQVEADLALDDFRVYSPKMRESEVPRALSGKSDPIPVSDRIARYVAHQNEDSLLINIVDSSNKYPLLAKVVGRHSIPPRSWIDFHLLWMSRGGLGHMLNWLDTTETSEELEEITTLIAESIRRTVLSGTMSGSSYLLLAYYLKSRASLFTNRIANILIHMSTAAVPPNGETHLVVINRLMFDYVFSDVELYTKMPLPCAIYLLGSLEHLFDMTVSRHAKRNSEIVNPFRFTNRLLNSLICSASFASADLQLAVIACAKQVMIACEFELSLVQTFASFAALLTPATSETSSTRNPTIRVLLPEIKYTKVEVPKEEAEHLSMAFLRSLLECSSSTVFMNSFARVADINWFAMCVSRFAHPSSVGFACRLFFESLIYNTALKEQVMHNQASIIEALKVHAYSEDLLLLLFSSSIGLAKKLDFLSKNHTILEQLDGIVATSALEPNIFLTPIFFKLLASYLNRTVTMSDIMAMRIDWKGRYRNPKVRRVILTIIVCCRMMCSIIQSRYRVHLSRAARNRKRSFLNKPLFLPEAEHPRRRESNAGLGATYVSEEALLPITSVSDPHDTVDLSPPVNLEGTANDPPQVINKGKRILAAVKTCVLLWLPIIATRHCSARRSSVAFQEISQPTTILFILRTLKKIATNPSIYYSFTSSPFQIASLCSYIPYISRKSLEECKSELHDYLLRTHVLPLPASAPSAEVVAQAGIPTDNAMEPPAASANVSLQDLPQSPRNHPHPVAPDTSTGLRESVSASVATSTSFAPLLTSDTTPADGITAVENEPVSKSSIKQGNSFSDDPVSNKGFPKKDENSEKVIAESSPEQYVPIIQKVGSTSITSPNETLEVKSRKDISLSKTATHSAARSDKPIELNEGDFLSGPETTDQELYLESNEDEDKSITPFRGARKADADTDTESPPMVPSTKLPAVRLLSIEIDPESDKNNRTNPNITVRNNNNNNNSNNNNDSNHNEGNSDNQDGDLGPETIECPEISQLRNDSISSYHSCYTDCSESISDGFSQTKRTGKTNLDLGDTVSGDMASTFPGPRKRKFPVSHPMNIEDLNYDSELGGILIDQNFQSPRSKRSFLDLEGHPNEKRTDSHAQMICFETIGILKSLIYASLRTLPIQGCIGGPSYGTCGSLLFQMMLVSASNPSSEETASALIDFFILEVIKNVKGLYKSTVNDSEEEEVAENKDLNATTVRASIASQNANAATATSSFPTTSADNTNNTNSNMSTIITGAVSNAATNAAMPTTSTGAPGGSRREGGATSPTSKNSAASINFAATISGYAPASTSSDNHNTTDILPDSRIYPFTGMETSGSLSFSYSSVTAMDVFFFNINHFTYLLVDMIIINIITIETVADFLNILLTYSRTWPARYRDVLCAQIMRTCVSVLNKPSVQPVSGATLKIIHDLTLRILKPNFMIKDMIEQLMRVLFRVYVSLPPVWMEEEEVNLRKKLITWIFRHIMWTYYRSKELKKALTVRTLTQRFTVFNEFSYCLLKLDVSEVPQALESYFQAESSTIDTLMSGRPKAKADLALKDDLKSRSDYIKRIKFFNDYYVSTVEIKKGFSPSDLREAFISRFSSYVGSLVSLDRPYLSWFNVQRCSLRAYGLNSDADRKKIYYFDSNRNYCTVELKPTNPLNMDNPEVSTAFICEEQINHIAVLVPQLAAPCQPLIFETHPSFIDPSVKLSHSAMTLVRYLIEPNETLRFVSNGFYISGLHSTPCLILLTTKLLRVIGFSYVTSSGDLVLCQYEKDRASSETFTTSSQKRKDSRRSGTFGFALNMTKHLQRLLTDKNQIKELEQSLDGTKVAQGVRQSTGFTYRNLYWIYLLGHINEVRTLHYMHQDTALLLKLHHDDGPMLSIVDASQSMNASARAQFVSVLKTLLKGQSCDFVEDNLRPTGLRSMLVRWAAGSVSTFDYLMYLNRMAGRTKKDLNQYPIFPWIIADYTSEKLNLDSADTYRKLSLPIGAQTEQRRQAVSTLYDQFAELAQGQEDERQPFHHGTHYSTSGGILYYLIRAEPFSTFSRIFQGGDFDIATRLFDSVGASYASCVNGPSDCKELIPEFYYNNMFLLNRNQIDFGEKSDGTIVGDVRLPPWAKGSIQVFTAIMRYVLESDAVVENIHEWVDLIFGVRRRGPLAVERYNVFQRMTYGEEVREALKLAQTAHECNVIISEVENFGQTPFQLFQERHPARRELEPTRNKGPGNNTFNSSQGVGPLANSNSVTSGHTYALAFQEQSPKILKILLQALDVPNGFCLSDPTLSLIQPYYPSLLDNFRFNDSAVLGFTMHQPSGKRVCSYKRLIPVGDTDYAIAWYGKEPRLMRFNIATGNYLSSISFSTPLQTAFRISSVSISPRESLVLVGVTSGTIFCLYPDSHDRELLLTATMCHHYSPIAGFAVDSNFGRVISFTLNGSDTPILWIFRRYHSTFLRRLDIDQALPDLTPSDRTIIHAYIDPITAFSYLITRRQVLIFDNNGDQFGVGRLSMPNTSIPTLEDEDGAVGILVDTHNPFVVNMTVIQPYSTIEWAGGIQLLLTGHQDGTVALWRVTRLPPESVTEGKIASVDFHSILCVGSENERMGSVTSIFQEKLDVPQFLIGFQSGTIKLLRLELPDQSLTEAKPAK